MIPPKKHYLTGTIVTETLNAEAVLKKDRVRKWKIGAFLGRSRVCEVLEFTEKRS